jgi:DNA polymerase III subunit delta'
MITTDPITQTKLFGLNSIISELIELEKIDKLPNKVLLSGQKGLGKSTLAYHFINYALSKDEDFKYNTDIFEINPENRTYKTTLNKSNPNLILIDIDHDKKSIDIKKVRELILSLNKYSFNEKPRFVLIDNIEFLNINSVNALLKVLEEPSENVYFFLINNNKKILPTLLSRCINFKIFLSNHDCIDVANKLLDGKLYETINIDLINYYSTPGNIVTLSKFAQLNNYDITSLKLKQFLDIIIKDKQYKKDSSIKYLIFDLIEFYLVKINQAIFPEFYDKHNFFLKRIYDTKRFNLDDESLFIEFEKDILNG